MATSGGYWTSKQEECSFVADYLDKIAVPFKDVRECEDADAADVVITFLNGCELSVEVKEEEAYRWTRYHQLGIDGWSSFYFLPGKGSRWKGRVHRAEKYRDFLQDVDMSRYHKIGKIGYSEADIWLFVCHTSGEDMYLGYWGVEVQSDAFVSFIEDNCDFAINSKDHDGSSSDDWDSLCWFVDPQDMPPEIFPDDLLVEIEFL